MKKMLILSSCLLMLLSVSTTAHAATPKEITEDPLQINVTSKQIVQVLPEGGFIFKEDGSGDFDPSNVVHNDGTLMTYDQYLALEKRDTSRGYAPFPYAFRSASPERASYNPRILAAGEAYVSDPFYHTGWRFSEVKFKPADGTGTWLLWSALDDSGCVGNEYEAYLTHQRKTQVARAVIGMGQSQYVDGGGSWLFFYTYNPVPGSRYLVANR